METLLSAVIAAGGFIAFYSAGCIAYAAYKKRKVIKPLPDKERIDILREYQSYGKEPQANSQTPQFVLGNPAPEILNKYNYPAYCDADGDDVAFKMLDFVCDNFKHGSNTNIKGSHSLAGVIKSCEKSDMKTNCRGLSLMLSELLRMHGIKARHITCMPYEEPFSDCHVVVDCLLPSGGRVMLDPTYRLYLTDDDGGYVSIRQLREGILAGRSFHPNSTASYNGGSFDYDEYIEYMTKNLLRFHTYNTLNDTDKGAQTELLPIGYSADGLPKSIHFTNDPDIFWDIP